MDTQELPQEFAAHAETLHAGKTVQTVLKYILAPEGDQQALADEAERHGIHGGLTRMWECDRCHSRFSVNQLEMVGGIAQPFPVCPTIGCSATGWGKVHPA